MTKRPDRDRKPPPAEGPSLKAMGVAWLSRREHSRDELRQKLLGALRRRDRLLAALPPDAEDPADDAQAPSSLDDAQALAFLDAFGEAPAASASPRVDGGSAGSGRFGGFSRSRATDPDDRAAAVEAALDWLSERGYLSDSRSVESRIHARAPKLGRRRIVAELARHGLTLDEDQAQQLRDTELERARAVWARRFGEPASDAKGRAAQARFLAARGFAADVIRRLVSGLDDLQDED